MEGNDLVKIVKAEAGEEDRIDSKANENIIKLCSDMCALAIGKVVVVILLMYYEEKR